MKKVNLLLIIISLVFIGCENEDSNQTINTKKFDQVNNFERLMNSSIGSEVKGKIELDVSEDKLMHAFKDFSKKYNPTLNPISYEIINIDNKFYLRFHSENNIVSTIALLKGDDNVYITGTTVCESTACSSSGGCVPNGEYCTECRPFGPNHPTKGDCKRTTTGFDPA